VNVDSEIKLLRNIRIFNLLSQVFLSKTGIAAFYVRLWAIIGRYQLFLQRFPVRYLVS